MALRTSHWTRIASKIVQVEQLKLDYIGKKLFKNIQNGAINSKLWTIMNNKYKIAYFLVICSVFKAEHSNLLNKP